MKPRSGAPIPTRSRLNFSVPELVDDRAEAVVAARPAALAEAELAERQREVVGDDEQVDERRVLAGEDLADGEPGVVHERQRLDERQVQAVEAAHRDRRRRRGSGPCPPSRPGRRAGRGPSSRCCGASSRTGRPGCPGRRRSSRRLRAATASDAHRTPNGPDPVPGGPAGDGSSDALDHGLNLGGPSGHMTLRRCLPPCPWSSIGRAPSPSTVRSSRSSARRSTRGGCAPASGSRAFAPSRASSASGG